MTLASSMLACGIGALTVATAGCSSDDGGAPDAAAEDDAGGGDAGHADAGGGDAGGDDAGEDQACPVDEPVRSASPGSDLACVGAVTPGTTSCVSIDISGTITAVLGGPIAATVEIFDASGGSLGRTDTPDGSYSLAVPVGPDGWSGRVLATAEGYWPHDVFELARPYLGNGDESLSLVTDELVDLQFSLTDAGTPDPAKGLLIVRPQDCEGQSLPGVTVDIDLPYEHRLYAAESGIPDTDLAVTSDFGGAIFTNVDLGTVHATVLLADAEVAAGSGTISAGTFTGVIADPR
ncbi:MAG: hypothetical protein HYY06_30245 [Deltaproteobacteria bacterium]|nr:hypothetical protein [Deltaproteobacteria bacterium]